MTGDDFVNIINDFNRDVFVGELVKNCVTEESTSFFGFAYCEGGKTDYYITEDETDAYIRWQQKAYSNIATTPIETITRRIIVSTDAKNKAIDHLRTILQTAYPPEYFAIITHCLSKESNDLAALLLEQYTAQITEYQPYFGHAHYSLINLAYRAKHLSESFYRELIQKNCIQQEKLDAVSNEKIYAGIGYYKADQKIAYYINAYLPNVFKRQQLLEENLITVSPIFYKRFANLAENGSTMKNRKDALYTTLLKAIDQDYLRLVQTIQTLTPAVKPCLFRALLSEAKPRLTPQACAALSAYAKLWNIPLV
jgi:hypothetical protein